MAGAFVIAQGGGPTAVINQTMVGAALEIRKRHPGVKVLGARHGVRGIRDGDYVDLTDIPKPTSSASPEPPARPSARPATSLTRPIATWC